MINNYQNLGSNRIVLVTGSAGFIGYHLSKRLLEQETVVIGYDNCNDYYDVSLKIWRLKLLETFNNFHFIKRDLGDRNSVNQLFDMYQPKVVVNLGAQAGV